jgi:hypothetical protein
MNQETRTEIEKRIDAMLELVGMLNAEHDEFSTAFYMLSERQQQGPQGLQMEDAMACITAASEAVSHAARDVRMLLSELE